MAKCCSPGCTRTDESDDKMYYEQIEGTWCVVCDKHSRPNDNVVLPLTDDIKKTPVGALNAIVEIVKDE